MGGIIITILALGIIVGLICFAAFRNDRDDWWIGASIGSFIALIVLAAPAFFTIVPLTSGIMPGYSEGERIGYFTKISKRGMIYKTWEAQMQIGTGEMAALQAPQELSTIDDSIASDIQSHLGCKAKVYYSEWAMMPFREGSSGYKITKIEWLSND